MFSLPAILYLSAFLFSIGTYGVLARRNILVVLMSLELMLNAVNIALVAFGRVHALSAASGEHGGQIFTLMVLAVAAAEAAIGLSLLLVIWRRWETIDLRELCQLNG
ncbi:MAG: NADH-quinone oxidoreductase subunit NuoK [Planctomycetota bacterium]|nr:NADH-quinone oxidoreductase subunit NuoK [Planctomycetota bacterium]MEE2883963.1 NADH-quinone oxidoreductase subunit NuoK [Planctomycetota bacterium]